MGAQCALEQQRRRKEGDSIGKQSTYSVQKQTAPALLGYQHVVCGWMKGRSGRARISKTNPEAVRPQHKRYVEKMW